jgi:hypothetical protein
VGDSRLILPDGPLASAVAARPEILEAYVFGSHAREAVTPLSDLDVAVYLDPDRVVASPFGYAADLTATLGALLGRRDVDLVVLNQAPPLLYHRVLSTGVRVFSRDLPATTTREGRALSRFCDYRAQLRRVDAALAARIAAGTFGR